MAARRAPRSDSSTTGRGKPKVEWKGYVNWQPTEQHKGWLKKWLSDKPDVFGILEECLNDGYKFSWSWDDYHSCYAASLYCTDAENLNAGWCASMRGGSIQQALERLLFFHLAISGRDWSSVAATPADPDRW